MFINYSITNTIHKIIMIDFFFIILSNSFKKKSTDEEKNV